MQIYALNSVIAGGRAALAAATLTLTIGLAGCAPSQSAVPASASFDADAEARAATAVLRSYEAALNKSDVATIVSLYAPEAVFMAQHRSPAVGSGPIETAYREIFAMIRLEIRFLIDEVVVVSPTVAYARTRSEGTTTILANGARVAEGNQELFVLVRPAAGGPWKIGRYIFSTTQPRR